MAALDALERLASSSAACKFIPRQSTVVVAVASAASGRSHMGFNYLTPGPFSINVRNPTAGTYIVAKARKLALD